MLNGFSLNTQIPPACPEDTEHPQREKQEKRIDAQCSSSTLPYALSRWPERSETQLVEDTAVKRSKLRLKSDSDSSTTSRSSPVEVRRKLSLLEEKRAIFQRRFFDSSKDTSRSDETVIAAPVDDARPKEQREEERKKKTRQISVRTFDTFSTLEGTFDDDAGFGYLDGIDEDYTENYNNTDSNYRRFHAAMAMMGAGDHLGKVRSTGC